MLHLIRSALEDVNQLARAMPFKIAGPDFVKLSGLVVWSLLTRKLWQERNVRTIYFVTSSTCNLALIGTVGGCKKNNLTGVRRSQDFSSLEVACNQSCNFSL
jgi:hypothetical protein